MKYRLIKKEIELVEESYIINKYIMQKQDIIIYEEENWKVSVDILVENETFWMTQSQIWELFWKDRITIVKHISNIYEEWELIKEDTIVQKTHNWSIKPTNYYNLDLILAVWYRVKWKQWVLFRKWASERLKEYLVNWFSINDEKIKSWKTTEYFDKLQDKLREIRLSEKILKRKKVLNNWKEILNLLNKKYATNTNIIYILCNTIFNNYIIYKKNIL